MSVSPKRCPPYCQLGVVTVRALLGCVTVWLLCALSVFTLPFHHWIVLPRPTPSFLHPQLDLSPAFTCDSSSPYALNHSLICSLWNHHTRQPAAALPCTLNDPLCLAVPADLRRDVALVNAAIRAAPADTPVAVIFEGGDRPHIEREILLGYLLQQAIQALPNTWRIHCFMRLSALRVVEKELWFVAWSRWSDKLVLHFIPENEPFTQRVYNEVLSSPLFWYFPPFGEASHVQLFELDSGFCMAPQKSLEAFTRFDYCGAPWVWQCRENVSEPEPTRCVGNSGFSIWNRSMMQALTQRFPAPPNVQVDLHWVPVMLQHHPNVRLCPTTEAQLYSVETGYVSGTRPFAWHKPFYELWPQEVKKEFASHCPSFNYQRGVPLP